MKMKNKTIMGIAMIAILIAITGCGANNPYNDVAGEWIDTQRNGMFEITSEGEIILKSGISPQTYALEVKGSNQFVYEVPNSWRSVIVELIGDTLAIGDYWKAVRFPWPAAGSYVWEEENETIILNPDYTISFGNEIKANCVISESNLVLNFITEHPDELPNGMVLRLEDGRLIYEQDGDALLFIKQD